MLRPAFLTLPIAALALSACDSAADKQAEAVEDRIETQAEADVAAAGSAVAALGLTEVQLLNADLVGADGTDLGDVELVQRNASGTVESLIVELDGTDPDRYVAVPISGLTTRTSGDDIDIQTTMTAAQLRALPDARMPQATAPAS